jgi:WD40 repeat protein
LENERRPWGRWVGQPGCGSSPRATQAGQARERRATVRIRRLHLLRAWFTAPRDAKLRLRSGAPPPRARLHRLLQRGRSPPGEQLDSSLRAALYRSKTLVVIANRATLAVPRWVRKEVEEFRTRHPARPIVAISVDGALQDRELAARVQEWLRVDDKIWLDETNEAVERGIASEALVERLATAPTRFRSNVSWRWVVRAVVTSLALLAIGLGVAAKLANDSAERARAELRRAVSLRLAAEAPAMLSGARREGDERALLQLVAASRLSAGPALDGSLLDAILRRRDLIKLIPSDAPVTSVAVSPDGTRIASGDRGYYFPGVPLGRGNNVRLWDATTGQAIGAPLSGHADAVTSVAFGRDGTRLVSASHDETVRAWSASTGQPIGAIIRAPASLVNAIAISPDGRLIASGHADKMLRLWSAETGEPLRSPLEGHEADAVAFSPDGARIVSGSFNPSVRVWDVKTGQLTGSGEGGGSVLSLAFSPDGARIVSGGYQPGASTGAKDDDLRLWDAHSGHPIGGPLQGHQRMVNSVAWSPDGTLIASGSVDTTIRVWNAQTAQPIGAPFEGHMHPVNAVAFSPDGRRLVSGGDDSTVRVWRLGGEASIGLRLEAQVPAASSAVFTRDGKRIVSGHGDGRLRFWDSRTRELVSATPGGDTGDVLCLAVSPDGERIVSGHSDGALRIWDIRSAALIGQPLEGHRGRVQTVAWSPDGARIASGGSAIERRRSVDHVVRLWDAGTGRLIAAMEGHEGPISSLVFTPNGGRIVSSSEDGTLRLWNGTSGQPLGAPLEEGGGPVAVSPDGARIVSSRYAVLRMRNARTGEPYGPPLEGHQQGLASVAFSPDGSRIVSGSMDGTIRVWDANTHGAVGTPLEGHRGTVASITFSPDGKQLVSTSDDDTIRVWPAPQTWADVLCAKLTRNMSRAEWRLWVSTEIEYTVQCPGLPIPPDTPERRGAVRPR